MVVQPTKPTPTGLLIEAVTVSDIDDTAFSMIEEL